MSKEREYDFVESDDLYKIYENRNRHHIIAVCQSAFDAMTVINALSHADVDPCDCSEQVDKAVEEVEDRYKNEIDQLKDDHLQEIDDLREEHRDEINSLTQDHEAQLKEIDEEDKVAILFDPS